MMVLKFVDHSASLSIKQEHRVYYKLYTFEIEIKSKFYAN